MQRSMTLKIECCLVRANTSIAVVHQKTIICTAIFNQFFGTTREISYNDQGLIFEMQEEDISQFRLYPKDIKKEGETVENLGSENVF